MTVLIAMCGCVMAEEGGLQATKTGYLHISVLMRLLITSIIKFMAKNKQNMAQSSL